MFFSDVKFVTHYTPALAYKETEKPLVYTFEINEETHLNEYALSNNYTQELHVELLYKGNKGYNFKIQTINSNFVLDKTLIQQGKLLNDLAKLTEQIELTVTKNGTIKSNDYKVVLKKWEDLKPNLLKTHQGNQASAYINGIDTKMKNEELFLTELKQVKLFGLLFNGYQAVHIKDTPKYCKISNCIHCLPVMFKETIQAVKENEQLEEKHISIIGSMQNIEEETQVRIQKYFTYFGVSNNPIFLSNYQRNVVLDIKTGYPKSVALELELTNASGYTRKQSYNLKRIDNG